MIGNDVIDLNLAATESNWKRKGWLQKVFTTSEQQLIAGAFNQNLMVWILWSMKESAYKIHHRSTKIRVYIPQQLVCSEIYFEQDFIYGKVRLGDFVFYTKTNVCAEFVHTIATLRQSKLNDLNVFFFNNCNEIKAPENIVKDNFGIPFLYRKTTRKKEILSISHHGKFCSYLSVKLM